MGATEDRFNRAWEDELSRLFRKAKLEENPINREVREGKRCGLCFGEKVLHRIDEEDEPCPDCTMCEWCGGAGVVVNQEDGSANAFPCPGCQP